VKRNLTLTIDEDLLRAARKVALDRHTSVNELVRQYLTGLVQSQDDEVRRRHEAAERLKELFRNSKYRIGGEITWTRDDLYKRR
jgi:hypothetical protein